jgi:polyketide cyclase/dehydrase/lipid transport protein
MQASVTVPMAASADEVWNIVADVRNTGKFSPEVIEAEWLDGATGPALGARFRGHVRRNEIGPVYWTTCRVTACEPGTDVTESFRMNDSVFTKLFAMFGGQLRTRRNKRDMRKTLERIKAVVETPSA